MLTDYHLHLRPDEKEARAADHFTVENASRYRERARELGIDELGVSEHVHRFAQALTISDHPWYRHWASDDLDEYCAFVREQTDLRLGIEVDYLPGREDRLAELVATRDFDYVVGSVHFVDGAIVDLLGDERWREHDVWRLHDPDTVWRRYFELLADAVRSGLFDILAHPDLVKVQGRSGPWPERDPRYYWEPALEALAESDVAVEFSTAGWRKPIGEPYPDEGFLRECLALGRVVALSSDAHRPDQIGYRYDEAVERLAALGVDRIAVFERRSRRLEPLG